MSPLSSAEKLAWLRLARSPGIGPQHATRLLQRFGSAEAAIAALPRLLATGKWGRMRLAEPGIAEAELVAARRQGATILVRADPDFPAGLAAIDDPPVAITVRGDPAHLRLPGIALVGARNASSNGRLIADGMARDLAHAGLAIVSGLARGIDTAAHRGAIAVEGVTIAVVAGGADIAYPQENAELMAMIAEAGLVVSERPLGAVPRAQDFPRRNRIIAGLAHAVVIVEAAPQSGSLITARLAGEQGREVMAVPGSPLDPRHRGTNQLLRDGATLVETAGDIIRALEPLLARLPASRPDRAIGTMRGAAAGPKAKPAAPPQRQGRLPVPWPAAAGDVERAFAASSAPSPSLGHRLRHSLGPDPVPVDELVRQCEASVATIQEALLDLELEGRLERHPGNRVSLRPG